MNTSKTKIFRNTNNLANGMECLIFSEPQTSPRKDLCVAKTYTNFKNNSIPKECLDAALDCFSFTCCLSRIPGLCQFMINDPTCKEIQLTFALKSQKILLNNSSRVSFLSLKTITKYKKAQFLCPSAHLLSPLSHLACERVNLCRTYIICMLLCSWFQK